MTSRRLCTFGVVVDDRCHSCLDCPSVDCHWCAENTASNHTHVTQPQPVVVAVTVGIRIKSFKFTPTTTPLASVGTSLKELGDHTSKCLKFCPGIGILSRFSLKNERLWVNPQTTGNCNPALPRHSFIHSFISVKISRWQIAPALIDDMT